MLAHATPDQLSIELALFHLANDGDTERVYRLFTDDKDGVGLLIVNRATPPCGIVPLAFPASSHASTGYAVVEVTPAEFDRIESGELSLPDGWTAGELIAEQSGAK